MTKRYLALVFFCSSMALYCMENCNKKTLFDRAATSLAQSSIVNKIDSWLVTDIFDETDLEGSPASPEIQLMGAEAQTAVGIPKEKQLPIREMPLNSVSANTEINAVYINKDLFYHYSYGTKRCVLFHEAVHAKYHDCLCSGLIPLATGFIGGPLLAITLKSTTSSKLLYPLSMAICGLIGYWFAQGKYNRYVERRADTEGCNATQCAYCVYERMAIDQEARSTLKILQDNRDKLTQKRSLFIKFPTKKYKRT